MGSTTLGEGTTLDPTTVAGLLLEAGATPDQAARLTAIGGLESGYRTNALNDTPATKDYSVGIWQENYYGDMLAGRTASYGSPAELAADPKRQAQTAVTMSGGPGGTNFAPWSTNKSVNADNLASAQAAVTEASQKLAGGGLFTIPQFSATFQAQGQQAAAAANSLIDVNSPWHSVLLNLDDILNSDGGVNVLNPAADLKIIVARSAVVLLGLTVSVFGLLVVVEAIAGDSGVKVAAGVVPGGKFAAGALDLGGAASNANSDRQERKAEGRRESRHQEDMRRSEEKAQARRDRARYKSASSKTKEEPF